jgi:hypothetical protein
MPTVQLNQDVVAAGGTIATDWAQAGGHAQVTFNAGAQVDRGINLELGIQALASIDASVGRYLGAEVSGQAAAAASVTAQIQAPMNLFTEVGFAVRLQAIAELAAAVQVGLALKVGDFLTLAEHDPQMQGLPLALLRVFLSEVDIKAGVYAKAALTAQAYAQVVVTGTAIAQPQRQIKSGFNIVAGAGVGLKAGAGFRVAAAMEIPQFSRFVARTVDVLVNNACQATRESLPSDDTSLRHLMDAAAPIFKIGFRSAYELGEYLARNTPGATATGAQEVALRCTQVVLEEAQRFLLKSFTDAAFEELRQRVEGWRATTPRAKWDASLPQRRALSLHLDQFPGEPFDGTSASESYWNQLLSLVVDLVTTLQGQDIQPGTKRVIAALWSAAQLALTANRRVVRADASLSVIGQQPRQAHAAFAGQLSAPPPALVRDHIRASLNLASSRALKLEDLVTFLVLDAPIDLLRQHVKGADRFLAAMTGPFGTTVHEVTRTILRNIGSIVVDGRGRLDAQATLAAVSTRLRSFLLQEVKSQLAPAIRTHLAARPDLITYLDEVFLPTAEFTFDTVFAIVLDWTRRGANKEPLKEALSGVLMKLFGRSLVVTTDILLATTQAQIHGLLTGLADQVDAPNGIVTQLARASNLPVPASEIAELTADALRIGAEVLGPLTPAQRARIRSLMYVVIDPLPPAAGADFLQQLADKKFLPNADSMRQLAIELGTIGGERFLQFVQKLIDLIAKKALASLAEVLQAAQKQIRKWVGDAEKAMADLQRALGQLVLNIERLGLQTAQAFDAAAEALFGALSPLATHAGRNHFRAVIAADVSDAALSVLEANEIYRNLAPPALRQAMRRMVREAVEEALESRLIDSVLDIIGEVAVELDTIMDDVRELDPEGDLAEQIGDLMQRRVADALYDELGRDPAIRVGFDVMVFGRQHRIALGRIEVPVELIADAINQTFRELDVFEDAIKAASRALAGAFAIEQALHKAEADHAAARSRLERLNHQRSALIATPSGVRILSPVAGSVGTGTARIVIELQGIPREAAIHNDAPASVHVFLNDRELVLSGFTITELGAEPPAAVAEPVVERYAARRFDPMANLELKPHPASRRHGCIGGNAAPRGGMRALDSLALKGPAQKASNLVLMQASAAARAARGAPSFGLSRATTPSAIDTAAAPAGLARRAERRFGAKLTVSQLGKLVDPSVSGLILARALPGGDLELGLNTLVVSVVPAHGPPVEASCAFFVDDKPASPSPVRPGAARLPITPPAEQDMTRPLRVTGKVLLRPRAERDKIIAAQKALILDRAKSKVAGLRSAMATFRPRKPVMPRSNAPKR